MQYLPLDKYKDGLLLAARILLMALFVTSGWAKLTGFSATVGYMASLGAPFPPLATGIAVVVEFIFGILIVLGFYTRPLALVTALFTLGTGFIAHHFWNMTGMDAYANTIHFYKNLSIIGGLIALAVAGPGRFSIDRK